VTESALKVSDGAPAHNSVIPAKAGIHFDSGGRGQEHHGFRLSPE